MTDVTHGTSNGNGSGNGVAPDRRSDATTPTSPPAAAAAEEAAGGGGGGRGGPFDLNAQQKKVLLVVLIVHVILARFTLRDLRRRPAAAVRGPKRLWRVWATVNTTGSLAYWLVGRRGDAGASTN